MNFMTTSTFAPPISVSDPDAQLAVALRAGWCRADLDWESLQEQGNRLLLAGNRVEATRCFRRAGRISFWRFAKGDPRRVTTLANLALADRLAGFEGRARRRYAKARRLWTEVDVWIGGMEAARRARSSLFHLRMEARHWDTYQDNMRKRMRGIAAETAAALHAFEMGEPSPHRFYQRWRGEKPSVFDDTRKFLAAALMIATDETVPTEPGAPRNESPRAAKPMESKDGN